MNQFIYNLAVVIVNWNRPYDTIECVDSILFANVPQTQIYIVDNGSEDDSIQQIKEKFPDVNLLESETNIGFAGGYNLGIQQVLKTNFSNVLIINNDTTVMPDSLQLLIVSEWDVAIPKIVYYHDPGRIWSAGCRWRRFPPSVVFIGLNHLDSPSYNISYPLDYATGCAMMIRRHVLEKIGGFDPIFESYYEDCDFCYRVRENGFKIGYVPQSKIFHKVSQTIGEYSPRRWNLMGRNLVIFYRKDNRFSWMSMWIYINWVIVREILKGHIAIIPEFVKGVREGLTVCRLIIQNASLQK